MVMNKKDHWQTERLDRHRVPSRATRGGISLEEQPWLRTAKRLSLLGEPINGGQQPLPEPPAPESKSHDYAGIGMFELLGLMCGLPPSEALYHGEPIDFRMVCFIVAGIFFGGLGTAWPVVRKRFPQQALVLSVSRIAADARYWLAIILVAFLYGVAPDIYRRATTPVAVTGMRGVEPAPTPQSQNIHADVMSQPIPQARIAEPKTLRPYLRPDQKEHFSHLMDEMDALLKDLANAASQIQRWDDTFRDVNSPEQLEQASKDAQNAVDIGNKAMSFLYESLPRTEAIYYEELNLRDGKPAVSGFRSQAKAVKAAFVIAQHAIKSDDETLRGAGTQMIMSPPRKSLVDSAQVLLAWMPVFNSNISAARVSLNDH
jgi:hypothetical protein